MPIEPKDFLATLLLDYSFDNNPSQISLCIEQWLQAHSAKWVASAIVESIYQGRYKLVSVDRILSGWRAKKQVSYHFDYDFAELVCQKSVQHCLTPKSSKPGSNPISSPQLLPLPEPRDRQFRPRYAEMKTSRPGQIRHTTVAIESAVKLVTKLAPIANAA